MTKQVWVTFYSAAMIPTRVGSDLQVVVKTREVMAYEAERQIVVDDDVDGTFPDHHIESVVERMLGRPDVEHVEVRAVPRGE